jgi:hypothetical protein
MHVQAQSWVLPNVFDVGNAVKQLTWTRMASDTVFLSTQVLEAVRATT